MVWLRRVGMRHQYTPTEFHTLALSTALQSAQVDCNCQTEFGPGILMCPAAALRPLLVRRQWMAIASKAFDWASFRSHQSIGAKSSSNVRAQQHPPRAPHSTCMDIMNSSSRIACTTPRRQMHVMK